MKFNIVIFKEITQMEKNPSIILEIDDRVDKDFGIIKTTLIKLDPESNWTPFTVFHAVRLQRNHFIKIKAEGVELDGGEFCHFLIKRIFI